MCGRFNGSLTIEQIEKFFQAKPAGDLAHAASHNVAPTERTAIVVENADGERELQLAKFGMNMTMPGKSFLLINIQSEKAANRKDFKSRRCIIPVAGFYEWEKISPQEKQPHYYSAKDGLLPFAGVWNGSGDEISFLILTTKANDLVAPIHSRMPVILSHNAVGSWLAPNTPSETLTGLMESFPANLMQEWKVSKTVNSPKTKDASCINSL